MASLRRSYAKGVHLEDALACRHVVVGARSLLLSLLRALARTLASGELNTGL